MRAPTTPIAATLGAGSGHRSAAVPPCLLGALDRLLADPAVIAAAPDRASRAARVDLRDDLLILMHGPQGDIEAWFAFAVIWQRRTDAGLEVEAGRRHGRATAWIAADRSCRISDVELEDQ